jgi:hypothetical protein
MQTMTMAEYTKCNSESIKDDSTIREELNNAILHNDLDKIEELILWVKTHNGTIIYLFGINLNIKKCSCMMYSWI